MIGLNKTAGSRNQARATRHSPTGSPAPLDAAKSRANVPGSTDGCQEAWMGNGARIVTGVIGTALAAAVAFAQPQAPAGQAGAPAAQAPATQQPPAGRRGAAQPDQQGAQGGRGGRGGRGGGGG